MSRRRKAHKKSRESSKQEHWHDFTDAFSAYLAEDFPALYDLEMREQYGEDWEQRVIERCTIGNKFNCETDSVETLEDPEVLEACDGTEEIPF
jgi:hypothetical protein